MFGRVSKEIRQVHIIKHIGHIMGRVCATDTDTHFSELLVPVCVGVLPVFVS